MAESTIFGWPTEFSKAGAPLLQAVGCAESLQRAPWDFAVELSELNRVGLSRVDLRWLVCQGFLEHAVERAQSPSGERAFRTASMLSFFRRTCFILTPSGRSAVIHLGFTSAPLPSTTPSPPASDEPIEPCSNAIGKVRSATVPVRAVSAASLVRAAQEELGDGDATRAVHVPATNGALLKPVWDEDLNRLTFGSFVVKEYRTPARNQQLVLSVFQEEGWPLRIDDPLPPHPDLEPKRRLHETINSLNQKQRNRVLRFSGDGHGQGVRWLLRQPSGLP